MLLRAKKAIVTGGAAGIGKQIALSLAREGADVIIADKDYEVALATVAGSAGVISAAYRLDISDAGAISEFAGALKGERIDILVNNAGVSLSLGIMEMTPEKWDFVMDINCRGTFFMSQAFFPGMLERGHGRIINIASISGERPPNFSDAAYGASKAAVLMLTKIFAKNAAGTDVTVNAVSPGVIETEMTRRIGSSVTAADLPLGRMGMPEEVADAVVFLASPMASYISGQNIRVNGGQYM